MPHHIDQSGKIEDTHKDTILALAGDDFSYALGVVEIKKIASCLSPE